ncbi:hypothetical protein [Amycolatopsis antarctica]|nr:hypothetical protein [Amycolatopsis antarctica]
MTAVVALTVGAGGTAAATTTPEDEQVLRASNYKALHLGQSEADALATGLLVNPQPAEGCVYYSMPVSEGRSNLGGGVFVEPSKGVVVISGTDQIRTPAGIGIGAPLDDVEGAYPALAPTGPTGFVFDTPAPGGQNGERFRFAVDEVNAVSDFAAEAADTGTCTTS